MRGHRLGPVDDELYQRTTVTVMQKNPAAGAVIYSYSPRGFNISGNTVLGPCAVLPPAILQWNVRERERERERECVCVCVRERESERERVRESVCVCV